MIVRWTTPCWPAGIMAARRAAAPPVSSMVGLPPGRLTTPHVAPEDAARQAGSPAPWNRPPCPRNPAWHRSASALLAPIRLAALGLGKDPLHETLAVALERLLDAANVDQVTAKPR